MHNFPEWGPWVSHQLADLIQFERRRGLIRDLKHQSPPVFVCFWRGSGFLTRFTVKSHRHPITPPKLYSRMFYGCIYIHTLSGGIYVWSGGCAALFNATLVIYFHHPAPAPVESLEAIICPSSPLRLRPLCTLEGQQHVVPRIYPMSVTRPFCLI